MAYCTQTNIIHAIGEEAVLQLTDDDNVGMIVEEHVARAIASADAEIDGYCAGKYAVPFTAIPAIIQALAIEIAVYHLYKRRTVPEKIEKAYDKALARLKDIARGLLSLGVDPPPSASASAGAETNKTVNDRVFTRNSMRGF